MPLAARTPDWGFREGSPPLFEKAGVFECQDPPDWPYSNHALYTGNQGRVYPQWHPSEVV
jgi:hypothetical protein